MSSVRRRHAYHCAVGLFVHFLGEGDLPIEEYFILVDFTDVNTTPEYKATSVHYTDTESDPRGALHLFFSALEYERQDMGEHRGVCLAPWSSNYASPGLKNKNAVRT